MTGGVATRDSATPIEVVARLADGLARPAEMHDFLADIARSARSMLDIDRVTIFTLEGATLVPAVSASRLPDDELWTTFQQMPPVAVDVTGVAAEVVASRHPTVVDARTSPLVPPAWRDTFGLSTLAIAPLRADGDLRGVLVADSAEPQRATFSRDQLSAIGAVASLAGLALRRFDIARRTALRAQAAYGAVHAVAAAGDPPTMARACAAGLRTITDARSCVVATPDGLVLLESDPPGQHIADSWPQVVQACREAGPQRLAEHGDLVAVGLWHRGVLTAVAALAGTDLAHATDDTAQAVWLVAEHTALALDCAGRATSLDAIGDRDRAVAVAITNALAAAPAALVEELARALRRAASVDVLDLVVAGRARAHALGLRMPAGADADVVGRWRRSRGGAEPESVNGRLLFPVRHADEVVGAMILRTTPSSDLDVVAVVTDVVGVRLVAETLRSELQDHATVSELAALRENLERSARLSASRMLDAAVSAMAGASTAAARNGAVTPARADQVAQILAGAKDELATVDETLLRLGAQRSGLGPKLRALAKTMARPGTTIDVRTERGVGRVDPPGAMQLTLAVRDVIGLAHETRAGRILIRISERDTSTVVAVKADGRLSLASGPTGPSAYSVVRGLQRELETIGVRVEMDNDGSWFTVRFVMHDRTRTSGSNLLTLRPRVGDAR